MSRSAPGQKQHRQGWIEAGHYERNRLRHQGSSPVREWLRGLSKAEKRVIGSDIKTVQYGWPIGMPVVRKLEAGLWEVRSRLDQRISRILFTVHGDTMVLLHGFIKKSQKTPKGDLQLAKDRKANLEK